MFSLNLEQLSNEQRTVIWKAVSSNLGTLIQNGSQLRDFFSLTPAQLSDAQRTVILDAISERLTTLIPDASELDAFLRLMRKDKPNTPSNHVDQKLSKGSFFDCNTSNETIGGGCSIYPGSSS